MLHVFGYYTFDEIFVYTFVFLCHLGFYFILLFWKPRTFSLYCVFIVFNSFVLIVNLRGYIYIYIYILMCYYKFRSFFVSGKNQTISTISLAL